MMEDGEVALNGLADLPKESEPTKDVAPEKSDLEAPLSPQNTSSPDHKRKRENKDETTGSPKRHKEHKHKKHKKHKKEKKSSSPEATHRERGASGSRSPSPKDKGSKGDRDIKRTDTDKRTDTEKDHRRSNSRENRPRGRSHGRSRSQERDRRGRSRDRREPSRGRRDGSRDRRGRDDRGGRDRGRDNGRDNARDRPRETRDYSDHRGNGRDSGRDRPRDTRDRGRGQGLGRETRDVRREDPSKAKEPEKKESDPVADAAAAEEEEAYRRRIEEQMMAMDSDEDSEDEEAKAVEESRKRRQAILDKHKKDEAANGIPNASGTDVNGSSSDHGGLAKNTDADSSDEDDVDAQKAGDVDEAQMMKEDEEQMAKKLGSPKGPQQTNTYDMFGDDAAIANANHSAINRNAGNNALDNDNWDDADGYYKFQMGEKMQERYEVYEVTGKGVFSNVLRARDVDEGNREVAIKIIRNNDMMKKCGDKELEILKLIAKDHGADKHNIVQLHEHFWLHGHLCLVFEALAMNLREVIKKFGNKKGINVGAVHKFAKQMFVALKHMKACKIIHADIKPDNILVNDRHNQIKICDFGSASYIEENDITPYLVSRWYRAPEITLCIKYDYGIDMWSIATCLYELYTGKVMFSGNTNNDMLRRFMEIKGKFPNKLLKRSINKQVELGRPVDFTDDFKFMRVVEDKVTKKQAIKIMTIDEKPEKDLLKLCMPHKIKNPDEAKMVKDLVDLLHHCLALNAEQRYSPEQALKHAFVKTQIN